MPLTEAQAMDALRPVEDPELHRSIVDLGMVRNLSIDEATVRLQVALTVPGCPLKNEIQRRVTDALTELDGIDDVDLTFTVMTDEELATLREVIHGAGAGAENGNGHAGHGHGPRRPIPFANPTSRTRVMLIASGKGGVGKSSVTTNLAVALSQRGHRVGILDADVYGFSIPRMLGVDRPPTVIDDNLLLPPESFGVASISMGFFADEDQPVIWRGPMMHKAIEQFLTDVFWDEPDFLLIDLPPGTGDVSLSLAQFLPNAEMYIVTTPQPAAQKVAQRAGFMARNPKVQLDLKGVIENMSWFTGNDGTRYAPFGEGGGAELAELLKVPLIAQIPLLTALREGSDSGQPIAAVAPTSEGGQVFAEIAQIIDDDLGPTRRYHPELKII